MSTLGLFDNDAEKTEDQAFKDEKTTRKKAGKTDSFFKRGSRFFHHKSDEEYSAEYYWQLYPGLVIEVVIANPFSLVARGHVEPVLTRVQNVNCSGVPGRMHFGVGGYVNFDELRKPIRCFPYRHNWGVVGQHLRLN